MICLVNSNQSSAIVYSCYSLNRNFEVVVANICLICTFYRWKHETKLFRPLRVHYDLTWFTFQRTPQTTWHFMWRRKNTNLDLWFASILPWFTCSSFVADTPAPSATISHPPLHFGEATLLTANFSSGELVWTNWKEECQVLTWTWLDNS